MYAIANALEGMSRATAARLVGLERQALRDAVVRYNGEGLAGLYNRCPPPRPGKLAAEELGALSRLSCAALIRRLTGCRAGPYRSCAA
jgi:transposase